MKPLPKTHSMVRLAKRYIWWASSRWALSHPELLIALIMESGTWDDIALLRKTIGDTPLRKVLKHAPAGYFHWRAWNYWHYKFGIKPIPELPKRKFA